MAGAHPQTRSTELSAIHWQFLNVLFQEVSALIFAKLPSPRQGTRNFLSTALPGTKQLTCETHDRHVLRSLGMTADLSYSGIVSLHVKI